MGGVRLRGSGGTLRRGGHVAATLGAWSLDDTMFGYVLSGTAREWDEYWLSQSPLTLTIPTGTTQEWTWRTGTSVVDGDQITVSVTGDPEMQ